MSMLGQSVRFQEGPEDVIQLDDTPFHNACVQELKLLHVQDMCVLSSLDRNGGLQLWLWGRLPGPST